MSFSFVESIWLLSLITVAFIAIRALAEKRDEQSTRWGWRDAFPKAVESIDKIDEMLKGLLVLDSYVWMSSDAASLFDAIEFVAAARQRVLVMPRDQFDELCNARRGVGAMAGSSDAKLALTRIEKLQSLGLLHIESVGISSTPKVSSEPTVLVALVEVAARRTRVTLISQDEELRIRARSLLSDRASGEWEVLDLSEPLTLSAAITRARNNGLISISEPAPQSGEAEAQP